jgi:hypothetical protein
MVTPLVQRSYDTAWDGMQDDLKTQIVEVLGRGVCKARFVSELANQVHQASAGIYQVLEELEATGQVLIREQYCADPHLEGADLRIVALVLRSGDTGGSDPWSKAAADIETTWNRWLGEYLANHRCG